MILRPYQEKVLDDLWAWFGKHADGNPIIVAAVGAGKSLMIAATAKRMDAQAPGVRTLVLMHQKELLEQNVDKVKRIWPDGDVGVYSASAGRKELGNQVMYATIGSVWKIAHLLGRIDLVHADECHLINPKEEGMWRSFLADLSRYNPRCRVLGWTGTEYRGNGVYLTAAKTALFTHVASRITMKELLAQDYLSPLTPAKTQTRVEAADLPTSGDDYQVSALAAMTDTDELVEATASEIHVLFSDRRRGLVFAVTVEHATHMRDALRRRGIRCEIVSANTPKAERAAMIGGFRDGSLYDMLVNVAVLTTGFDAPEVDFIAMLRATKSPVLYVQIAGRGMRLAAGKDDCLWADFTDTTLRLGPVDEVKGRMPRGGGGAGEEPFRLCPECSSRNKASAAECLDCGFLFPPPELIKHKDYANGAAVLSSQVNPERDVDVTRVTYDIHDKPGMPSSLRVEYWSGIQAVAREWVCLDHSGYARLKAEKWWRMRAKQDGIPRTVAESVVQARGGAISEPMGITIDIKAKRPDILAYRWTQRQEAA